MSEKQDEAIEKSDKKELERKKPHAPVPYASFVKYITEKYGLGDSEDFKKRINSINKFYDNVEIGNNIQSLGAKAKSESIKKGKDLFLLKGLSKDESIEYWDEMANSFNDVLKKLELKEMNESELLNAMKDKGFVPSTDREASRLLHEESSNAINNFSKKGQEVPFKKFNPNKPRSSVASSTKKFNTIKKVVDVLSNAKLNTFLDLLLTPTPLYEPSIEDIRKIRPNISITTDVIVGFPGETRELFEKTIETCRKLEFAKIHVFPYSERKGTKAIELPNHVDSSEKKSRARELLLVSKELEIAYAEKFIGKTEEVLIEENKDDYSLGHTSNYLHVKIPRTIKPNTFVSVTIKEIEYPYCLGE